MRVNAFAILSQRANIVCLRVSKMRPMGANSRTPRAGASRLEIRALEKIGLARIADHALEVEVQRVEHRLRDGPHLLVDVVLAIERVLAIVEWLGAPVVIT